MYAIKKIIFSIIPLVMVLGTANAATETVTYCPSDPDNKAIYTFKKDSSLPEGWTPSASWNLYNKNIITKPINSINPADITSNLTEGQYSFFFASLYQGKLSCTYVLLGKDEYKGALAILSFTKPGVSLQSIEVSPVGSYKNWFSPAGSTVVDDDHPLMCGSSVGQGAKVTDCPFKQ